MNKNNLSKNKIMHILKDKRNILFHIKNKLKLLNPLSKLTRFILMILASSTLLLSNSQAANLNNSEKITGINIDLHATLHHVGVQVTFSGDSNRNATAKLEANINGKGFKTVHRLSRVANDRFVGSVFKVKPDTDVKVRVTLLDSDGTTNATFSDSITTRSTAIPQSSGKVLHVSVETGNDETGNGSASKPYATIAHAVMFLKPDVTVLIHQGIYHEQIDIPFGYGGTEDKPATLRSAGDGDVILEGFSPEFEDVTWKNEGNNIYSSTIEQTHFVGVDGQRLWRYNDFEKFEDLAFKTNGGFFVDEDIKKLYIKLPDNAKPEEHEIQVSVLDYALQINNISHLVIKDLTFRGYGVEKFSNAISISEESEEIWIVNNRFENMETSIWLEGYSEDIIIMNNDFSDYGVNQFNWDHVKEHQWWLERGAVFCSNDDYSGRGLIFYKNTVHDMFDGIKITGTEKQDYANNSDVEGNIFRHLSDDGVETDGWSSNVRVVNNRFEDLLSGVSVAPAQGGPTYVIGNIISDLNNVAGTDYETVAVKFNVSDEPRSGEIFVYHNTATSTQEDNQAAFSVTNHTDSEGIFLKNNIWVGTAYAFYYWLKTDLDFSQDYDLHFSFGDNVIMYQGKEYSTIKAYAKRSNNCKNCKMGDPLFKDSDKADYNLTTSSPAIDQGVVIFGVNDHYSGTAPDMGALEYTK